MMQRVAKTDELMHRTMEQYSVWYRFGLQITLLVAPVSDTQFNRRIADHAGGYL